MLAPLSLLARCVSISKPFPKLPKMAAFSTIRTKLLTTRATANSPVKQALRPFLLRHPFSSKPFAAIEKDRRTERLSDVEDEDTVPTSGISRPLSEILKELNKKVPETLLRLRVEDGFSIKYIPWHVVNRIMNLHAPEWSGEVRSITYSADGKVVSVVYRVTLHGTDAEIYRESIGTTSVDDKGYGDPVQKAEAMAFRRACARLGLGLHLYHEDMS